MSSRRTLALPLVAVLAALTLLAGACGSDSKADDSKKSTTTEKSADSSKSSEPTSTVSDAEFDAGISKAEAALKAAGKDQCKVMESFQSLFNEIGSPANATQRKQAGMLQLAFLRAIADAAPSDLSKEADMLRTAADKIEKEGNEANWSKSFLNEPRSIKGNKDYENASAKLMESISKNCTPAAGSGPATGAPGEAGSVPTP